MKKSIQSASRFFKVGAWGSAFRACRLFFHKLPSPGALILCLLLSLAALACREQQAPAPPQDLQQARQAFSRGLYLQAEGAFQSFLQNHPEHPARWEAYSRLVDIALSVKNDPGAGLDYLERMLPEFIAQRERALQVLLQTGDLHRTTGHLDQAITVWRRAWSLGGVSARELAPFSLRLARALRAKGEFEASRETLERCRITALEPGVQNACAYELALTSALMDDTPRARALLEALLQQPTLPDEDRAVAAFLLADILAQAGEYARARDLLDSIRAFHPNPLAVSARLQQLEGK